MSFPDNKRNWIYQTLHKHRFVQDQHSIAFLSCQKTSEHKHSWFLNPHSHLHYPLKKTYTKMKLFFQNPCPFEYHNYIIISKENFNIAWFVSKKVSMKWILPSKNDLPWKISFPDFANKPPFISQKPHFQK